MTKLKWTPDKPIILLRDEIEEIQNTLSGKDYKAWCDANMSELPTAEIPENVDTSYPIWAMDNEGFCLIGEGDFTIEHINNIKESI